MTAEMSLESLYDTQGKSRFLHKTTITSHPLSSDHCIPPLWLGTLSDLVLIDNPARTKFSVNHDNYKTLEKYIRLSWGSAETPVYIVDHHETALYCWYEAFAQEKISSGASLRHYDDHSDAAVASNRASVITADKLKNGTWSLGEAVEAVKKLGCWEFIEPAKRSGLIDTFLYITPASTDYVQYYPKNDHHTAYTEMSIRRYMEIPPENGLQNKIVDIDLDFFASKKLNIAKEELYIQTMRQDIATAGVTTFATSPGFIDQARAVELVKKILT